MQGQSPRVKFFLLISSMADLHIIKKILNPFVSVIPGMKKKREWITEPRTLVRIFGYAGWFFMFFLGLTQHFYRLFCPSAPLEHLVTFSVCNFPWTLKSVCLFVRLLAKRQLHFHAPIGALYFTFAWGRRLRPGASRAQLTKSKNKVFNHPVTLKHKCLITGI